MFIDKGFNPKNLVAIGYADTMPEIEKREPASIQTPTLSPEEVLSKNRRVVIRILDSKSDSIPLPISVESQGFLESTESLGGHAAEQSK